MRLSPSLKLIDSQSHTRGIEFAVAGTPGEAWVHMVGSMLLGVTHRPVNGIEEALPIGGVTEVKSFDDEDHDHLLKVQMWQGNADRGPTLSASFSVHKITIYQYMIEMSEQFAPAVTGAIPDDGTE